MRESKEECSLATRRFFGTGAFFYLDISGVPKLQTVNSVKSVLVDVNYLLTDKTNLPQLKAKLHKELIVLKDENILQSALTGIGDAKY